MNRLKLLLVNPCKQKIIQNNLSTKIFCLFLGFFCSGVWLLSQLKAQETQAARAKIYEVKEQFPQAIEAWQRLLLQNSNSIAGYWGLARSYMRLGNYTEALNFVDQAMLLANQNHEIGVLKSRILRNLGRYNEAQSLLEQLQERHESPAIDLALAQLALVLGDTATSIAYLDSIREERKLSKEDLAFLLTSLIVYEEMGDLNAAERYLREAFNNHYNEAVLHKVAATYYLRRRDYGATQRELRIAKSLGVENEKLRLLGLKAAYLGRDFRLAAELGETLVKQYPKNGEGWYLLGLAYTQAGQLDKALAALNTARRIEPKNEWTNMVMAELLRTRYDYPSTWHSQEARRYIGAAKAKREDLLYQEALQDYRFALQLDPLNPENWMTFASVFRDRGNYGKYLDKLYAWREFGAANTNEQTVEPEMERLIGIYEASQRQSVAENWGLKQYEYENRYYPLQVFVLSDTGSILIPAALLGSYFVNILQWYEQPLIVGDVEVVRDPLEAQQIAFTNGANSDYYAVLDFSQSSGRINLGLYLSSTGRQVQSLNRKMDDNIYDVFWELARQLHELFPQKGQVIATKMNQVVLSLGSLDGVKNGDEWVVLPREVALGTALVTGQPSGYGREQILGTLTIEEVDEKISEGNIQLLGNLGNPVQVGDIALVLPPEEILTEEKTEAPTVAPEQEGFFQRVRGWFGGKNNQEETATEDEREGLIQRLQGWFGGPDNQEQTVADNEQKGFIKTVKGWFKDQEQTNEVVQPVTERRPKPNIELQMRLQELP